MKRAALNNLEQLKPAPYNPRKIDPEALAGLGRSLSAFGDISGIVWNRRTGHLVAGHQRLAALRDEHHGTLALDGECIVTPTGERFPVRVVDWDDERERLANVAANSPHIAGLFDQAKLDAVLSGIDSSQLFKPLRLDRLLRQRTPPAVEIPEIYEVLVECATEREQREVFDKMKGDGHKCRILTV